MKEMLLKVNRIPVILIVALMVVAAGAAETAFSQDLVSRVDEYLKEEVKQRRFSGAILIARTGRVLLSKGYGMANYEVDAPNTPQTKFRLGSLTKQFTATAIMMLAERGKLNVQDPVCKYLPDCPAAWQAITIHHLLTHTSGIWNFTAAPEYRKTMALASDVLDTIARFKDRPLDFPPGEQFNYSNSGYVLLGHLIESVSGQTYEAFLRENIFEPLKMTNTGYDAPDRLLKHRASGYSTRTGTMMNAPYLDMTIPFAAGALYSTVEDLYLWDQALYTEKLVRQKSLAAMFTPFKTNYGYGFSIDKKFGLRHISHGGAINGFNSFISRYPDERATIIVLANIDGASMGQTASRLARLALADKIVIPTAVKIDEATLQSYAGKYQLPSSVAQHFIFEVKLENGELFVKPTNQFGFQVAALSAAEFFNPDQPENRLRFQKDEKGQVTGMVVNWLGPQAVTAPRLSQPASER